MEEKSICAVDKFEITPAQAFLKYSNTVYRLAYARTKSFNDADDILQEVFLRYLKYQKTVQSEEHLKALLIRITINCSKSLLTSSWFKKTEPIDNAIEIAVENENSETLNAVLRLPVKYRTVIHLYYYCGYSVNEISEILKSNPSTVKSQLMRAREKLRNDLKGVDFDV